MELPLEVVNRIMLFNSHPIADLFRNIVDKEMDGVLLKATTYRYIIEGKNISRFVNKYNIVLHHLKDNRLWERKHKLEWTVGILMGLQEYFDKNEMCFTLEEKQRKQRTINDVRDLFKNLLLLKIK